MTDIASHVAGGVRQSRRKRDRVRDLFDDLSVAQVLAGALAAVTSMLLASQIGIYGSVIGVGVGSVISAVASQLYKKFLSASADKIREVGGYSDGGTESEGRDVRVVEGNSAATIALPAVVSGFSASDTAMYKDANRVRARAARQRKERVKQRVLVPIAYVLAPPASARSA